MECYGVGKKNAMELGWNAMESVQMFKDNPKHKPVECYL